MLDVFSAGQNVACILVLSARDTVTGIQVGLGRACKVKVICCASLFRLCDGGCRVLAGLLGLWLSLNPKA